MRTRFLTLVVAVAVFGGGACKNDSSKVSARYCDAVSTVFNYDTGGPDESPAQVRATFAKALDDLREPFATLTNAGPDDAKAAARDLRSAFARSRTKGVDTTDKQIPANSALVGAVREGCDWRVRSVSAANYRFSGVPAELPAGRTAITFKNRTKDAPHLFLVIRVKDGVTKPLEQLVHEDWASADFDGFGGGAFAFPGVTANGLVDLKPGRYLYLCPIPLNGEQPGGPDHASKGMRGEFRVA